MKFAHQDRRAWFAPVDHDFSKFLCGDLPDLVDDGLDFHACGWDVARDELEYDHQRPHR